MVKRDYPSNLKEYTLKRRKDEEYLGFAAAYPSLFFATIYFGRCVLRIIDLNTMASSEVKFDSPEFLPGFSSITVRSIHDVTKVCIYDYEKSVLLDVKNKIVINKRLLPRFNGDPVWSKQGDLLYIDDKMNVCVIH